MPCCLGQGFGRAGQDWRVAARAPTPRGSPAHTRMPPIEADLQKLQLRVHRLFTATFESRSHHLQLKNRQNLHNCCKQQTADPESQECY